MLGEGCESSRGAVYGGVADGDYGNHDDYVHDGWQAADAGSLDGDNERGGFRVGVTVAVKKAWFGVWDQEAHDGQGDDVKECDSPEHLLHGSGE